MGLDVYLRKKGKTIEYDSGLHPTHLQENKVAIAGRTETKMNVTASFWVWLLLVSIIIAIWKWILYG